MTALWFVGGGLFLAAVGSVFVGWLEAPPLSQRTLWTITVLALAGSVACGVMGALPDKAAKSSAAAGTAPPTGNPVQCPAGSVASAPSKGVIDGVRVKSVNASKVCVAWINPHDSDVAGFIVSQYPQDSAGDVAASGAPYQNPNLSSQLINIATFDPSLRPRSGQRWKICITPFGKGLNSAGLYPTFDSRQGCSATFIWPG